MGAACLFEAQGLGTMHSGCELVGADPRGAVGLASGAGQSWSSPVGGQRTEGHADTERRGLVGCHTVLSTVPFPGGLRRGSNLPRAWTVPAVSPREASPAQALSCCWRCHRHWGCYFYLW